MPHPAMSPNNVAVITGGASGIGLAAAMRFAGLGMQVCIADIGEDRLAEAAAKLAAVAKGGAANVMTAAVDVSKFEEVAGLEAAVQERFGGTDILMNNAGIGPDSTSFGPLENWQRILNVNLWGVIHGTQAFAPAHDRARPAGSDHQHRLQAGHHHAARQSRLQRLQGRREGAHRSAAARIAQQTPAAASAAHLMIPGHVFTGLTARGRSEKPAGAWTPEQTIDFMIERIDTGDFYILCPGQRRAATPRRAAHGLWAAGDIIENRPALSRWHPDYAEAFARFVKGE